MAIGSDIGSTFVFDPAQQFRTTRVDPSMSTGNADLGIPMAKNLQDVEGSTEAYLNAYTNLQNFAKAARNQYGIDVTNPDLADPTQREFYKTFQKAAAQTMALGNALERGRENQKMGMNLAGQDPNFVAPQEEGRFGEYGTDFGTTKIPDALVRMEESLAKRYDNPSEYRSALSRRDDIAKQLQEAGAPKHYIDYVKSWGIDKEEYAPQRSSNNSYESGRAQAYGSMIDLYQGAVNGEGRVIESLKAFGFPDAQYAENENGEPVLYLYKKGNNEEPIEINLQDSESGSASLADALQNTSKYRKYGSIYVDPSQFNMTPRQNWQQEDSQFIKAATNRALSMMDMKSGTRLNPFTWGDRDERGAELKSLESIISTTGGARVKIPEKSVPLEVKNLRFDGDNLVVEFPELSKKDGKTRKYDLTDVDGQEFITSLFKLNPSIAKTYYESFSGGAAISPTTRQTDAQQNAASGSIKVGSADQIPD